MQITEDYLEIILSLLTHMKDEELTAVEHTWNGVLLDSNGQNAIARKILQFIHEEQCTRVPLGRESEIDREIDNV